MRSTVPPGTSGEWRLERFELLTSDGPDERPPWARDAPGTYTRLIHRDVLFMTEREDERVDASLGLKIAITDNLLIQPKATLTRNWSNIALYDYERWSASAALRYEF